MVWTSPIPIIIWAVIVIPLTIFLWMKPPKDKLTSIITLFDFGLFNLLFYLTVNWAIVYYYLSFLPWILVFALIIRYISFHYRTPFLPKKTTPAIAGTVISVILLLVLGIINMRVLRSFKHSGDHVLMMFPMREGLYVIVNGGNSLDGVGMNNHYNPWPGSEITPEYTQAYGIDIMEMTIAGIIGTDSKLVRNVVQDFEIYLEDVYSPCVGPVVHVQDGIPEAELYKAESDLGNYIVIQCVDYFITLANLKKGTIIVEPGQPVYFNMMIGKVGNSAKPGIPHLHVHATVGGWKEGEATPIPMWYDGAFAVNDFLTRNELSLR